MRFIIGSVCSVVLILVVSIPAARADDPGPPNSTIPTHVMLVGQNGGVSDPLGAFEIVVRDLANNPVPGSHVDLDFTLAPDVRLSAVPGPGLTVLCGSRQVQAITDAQGMVHASIRGGSRVGPASGIPNKVRIYADGVLQGTIPVSTPDLDGLNGVGANDLAMWLQDFFSTISPTRSDYNSDGFVGGGDLAIWLQIFLTTGSAVSDPACP